MRFFARVTIRRLLLPFVFLFMALTLGLGLLQALWPGSNSNSCHTCRQ